MKTLIALAVGIVIGAASLGLIWAATGGDATVRIFGIRHDSGAVEVGLQQQDGDGKWADLETPRLRSIPPNAEPGERLYSSPIVVPVEDRAEAVARANDDYLYASGVSIAGSYSRYFDSLLAAGESPTYPPLLCIVDPEDPGIEQLCDGMAAGYEGQLEILVPATLAEAPALIEALFTAEGGDDQQALGGWFATSLETVLLALAAEERTGTDLPATYWLELVDPYLAADDALICMVSHGGPEPDGFGDIFWGLAGDTAFALAGGLGVDLRSSAHADINEQIAAIRECIADGASSIAVSLPDPDALTEVVGEANAAGIPIISFNSGGEVAAEVGTALHFGLDDRRAGEIAGAAFNEQGVTGNVLCVLHEPKNVGLEARCDGFASVYAGEVERWYPSTQLSLPIDLLARINAGGVDGVLTLSLDASTWASWVLRVNEIEMPLGGFGFGTGTIRRVADGRLMFTIVDHPEIQAYVGTALAYLVERFRIDPSSYFRGTTIHIEPLLVGPDEAAEILESLSRDTDGSNGSDTPDEGQ